MIEQLIKEAQEKELLLAKMRGSARFKRILGRLIAMNLLRTNENVRPNRDKMKIKDLLWVGKIEPRVFELIPAIAIKKPSAIADLENAPSDLKLVMNEIRAANPVSVFRNAEPSDYMQWMGSVGQRKKNPTKLKSFRFQQKDLVLLQMLKKHGLSEIDAVRMGLQLLAQTLGKTKGS